MLCFGFTAVTNDVCKKVKNMHTNMLANEYRRTKILGVSNNDFSNVRKHFGSTPAYI